MRCSRIIAPPLVALAATTLSPALRADPAALVETARCGMCHHAQEQRLGPPWAAIAERYAGDETALDVLRGRVRAGSSGEWGKAPMPPVPEAQISDADLTEVLTWILGS
jgi:cytochrome c